MRTFLKRVLPVAGLIAFGCLNAFARVDEVSYIKNGIYSGKIGTYSLGGKLYLDASKTSKLVGGKVYWYPVSGRLMLQIRGSKVVFSINNDSVSLNDEKAVFSAPLIVRGGRAFLAMDFFVSKYFAKAFGFALSYNSDTGVLSAQREINIRSVNYFSYKNKTRVVIYLETPLDYQTSQKENNLFSITVPEGVIAGEEKINIGDGVVKRVDLFQENKMVRIIIIPDDNFGKPDSFKLSNPPRLVFDISKVEHPVAQSIAPSPDAGRLAPEGDLSALGGHAAAVSAIDPGPSGADSVIIPTSSAISEPVLLEVNPDTAPVEGVVSTPSAGVSIPDKMVLDSSGARRIVIDAGHGGKDPGGRRAFGFREKELNLLVAKELYSLFKGNSMFDALLTRTSDVFIPLAERSRIANDFKADIFISIHANASRDRREKGFEVYFMSEKASDPGAAEVADYENSVVGLEDGEPQADPTALLLHSLARNEYVNEGSKLAGLVSREIEKSTPFSNRNVKQAAFYVLRGTYTPGILVEMGFMSNSSDQKNLNDKKVRAKLAAAIYKGVLKYTEMKGWK
ncbi:MAG: hypothetical protein A2X34_08180 [Elusimicrobia bacterium GWC2_51_8]|nr:MAG: hypothetical protein A2X33_11350 [Elusimicrobia bacterium GWA2_51_34]OGR65224.1 MAG: hypothetical protein A2X34_08180 [Elusimicrobia bacterium GWC2_51_8]OGR88131.1 MAG: hypothetical protein A2021_03035 [Elusimicrobia bacterium GWF2_52_66]HAF96430.1 hypothetical protein [Elusimicrobiota bacterium]HCE97266.1 hypothetical protein [Elusimicrobiota bacterium]